MIKKYSFLIVTTVAVVLILYLLSGQKSYRWDLTLEHKDKQPFGCAIFDSVMSASLPEGYEVKADFVDSLNPKTDAVLYVKQRIGTHIAYDNKQEIERARKIMKFANKGGVVILAAAEMDFNSWTTYDDDGNENEIIDDSLYEAWGIKARVQDYYVTTSLDLLRDEIKSYIKKKHNRWSVTRNTDDKVFKVYQFMVQGDELSLSFDPKKHTPLFTTIFTTIINDTERKTLHTIAFSRKNSKGGVVEYVSVPLFFTNYAMMDEESSNITESLLEPVAGRHLVRIVGVNHIKEIEDEATERENHGIFNFFLKHEALKWALYLTLLTLLLFSIFTMRRKMRPIPLLKETRNTTLEFAKNMGTYYFSLRNHSKPVQSEYESFTRELHELYGWNVDEMSNIDLSKALADKTGEGEDKILRLIRTVNSLYHDHKIEQRSMMELIDYIKLLKSKL